MHQEPTRTTSVQRVVLLRFGSTTAGCCCLGVGLQRHSARRPRSGSRGRLLRSCRWDVKVVGGQVLMRVVVDIHGPRSSTRGRSRGLRAFPELSGQPVSAGSLSRVLLRKHAAELLPFLDGLRWCKLRRLLHPDMFRGRAGGQKCDHGLVVVGSLSQGVEILLGQEGDHALIVIRVDQLHPGSPARHRRRCLVRKPFQLAIGFPRCDELELPSAVPGPAFAPHQQDNDQERRNGEECGQWHAVVIRFIDDDWLGVGDVRGRRLCSTQRHIARPAADVHPLTEPRLSMNCRGKMGMARVLIQGSAPARRAHRTRVILPSTLQAAAHMGAAAPRARAVRKSKASRGVAIQRTSQSMTFVRLP